MLMLDRRTLLRSGSAAVGATALAAPALARAPRPGKQAQPGFYRFKLGAIEITAVSDGTLAFPAETLWGDRAEDARSLLTSTFQPSSPVGLQINTVLLKTGDKLVLIDAGSASTSSRTRTAGCSSTSPARATRRAISTSSCSLTSISTTCGASVTPRTHRCSSRRPNSSPARLRSPSGATPNCPANYPRSSSRWLARRI
jgi:hypothetical protein